MFDSFLSFLSIPSNASFADYCLISFIGVVVIAFFFDLIFFVLNQLRR